MTTENSPTSCAERRIGDWDATCTTIALADGPLALWQVAALERHVDRAALLGAVDDPPEPPYWALCWSGARVLADVVPRDAGRVIELGCGLGLPALAAARRGARVTCVDRVVDPLRFVRASAATNGVRVDVVVADVAAAPTAGGFDCVLAAELLYERPTFPALVASLRALLAPGGRVLLADAGRIDTRDFYALLPPAGFAVTSGEVRVLEEGWPVTVRVSELRVARSAQSP